MKSHKGKKKKPARQLAGGLGPINRPARIPEPSNRKTKARRNVRGVKHAKYKIHCGVDVKTRSEEAGKLGGAKSDTMTPMVVKRKMSRADLAIKLAHAMGPDPSRRQPQITKLASTNKPKRRRKRRKWVSDNPSQSVWATVGGLHR